MIERAAVFDESEAYRYSLIRKWGPRPGRVAFVMLNPSIADERVDDPTIRRCMAFAEREGYDQLEIVNLFAIRSKDPARLRSHPTPVGPENDAHILAAAKAADLVIAAWGVHGAYGLRARIVQRLLAGIPLKCLGFTSMNYPRHPLYVRGDAPLVALNGRRNEEEASVR